MMNFDLLGEMGYSDSSEIAHRKKMNSDLALVLVRERVFSTMRITPSTRFISKETIVLNGLSFL